MPKIKKKHPKSFGSAKIDHINPQPLNGTKSINIHFSFEEALRLHFSIGQALGKLNSYNRGTKAGRRTAVDLCVFPETGWMRVVQGTARTTPGRSRPGGD